MWDYKVFPSGLCSNSEYLLIVYVNISDIFHIPHHLTLHPVENSFSFWFGEQLKSIDFLGKLCKVLHCVTRPIFLYVWFSLCFYFPPVLWTKLKPEGKVLIWILVCVGRERPRTRVRRSIARYLARFSQPPREQRHRTINDKDFIRAASKGSRVNYSRVLM